MLAFAAFFHPQILTNFLGWLLGGWQKSQGHGVGRSSSECGASGALHLPPLPKPRAADPDIKAGRAAPSTDLL